APAIDSGIATYSSFYQDSPLDGYYPDGKKGPKEWYGYYAGKMSISKALERSANTIPCKIVKELGVENSYNFLTQKLELKHLTQVDKNLASLALGGCQYGITTTESAAAYAIFGNGGKFYSPVTYYYIENSNGEIVLEDDKTGSQAIKPATADIMNELLQNVVYGSSGTGRGIRSYSKMKVYAKTGTSSESNDLWMVAGTPYYVGSVWYGFDQPQQIWNAGAAANVWRDIMKAVHEGLEEKEFVESGEIIEAKYCGYTGKLAAGKCYWKKDGKYVPGVDAAVCDGKHKSSSEESSSSESSSSSSSGSSSVTSSTNSTSSEISGESSSGTDSSDNSSIDSVPSTDTSSGEQGDTSSDTSSKPPDVGGDSSEEGNSSEISGTN
ncbi:MAG: hypothetical protein IKK24_04235, partial [Clostridia bacterium]|nr:hypothetical protein [Clostridia bacterium]